MTFVGARPHVRCAVQATRATRALIGGALVASAARAAPAAAQEGRDGREPRRGVLLVSAQVADVSAVREVTPPHEVRRDAAGAVYAARLTVAGSVPMQIAVGVAAVPGESPDGAPSVSVRVAGGGLATLAPGGQPAVVAEWARPGPTRTLDLEFHVKYGGERRGGGGREGGGEGGGEGRGRRASRVGGRVSAPARLVYTVWFPGGP